MKSSALIGTVAVLCFGSPAAATLVDHQVNFHLAARNVLITTNTDTFERAVGVAIDLGNDGPADLRGLGPIRWMAPESIRAVSTSGSGEWWELSALSNFDVAYVPEPGMGWLVGFGLAVLRCRTRSRP